MSSRFTTRLAALALALAVSAGAAWSAVTLKTLELGNGPTIVFVHDLGSRGSAWLPVAKKLLVGHKTVLVDLPGHGDSPMIDPFSFVAAAEALDAVLARQEPARTVLVGHGVGGLVAMIEAKAHPQRIRGLVLVESGAKGLDVPDQQKKMFLDFIDGQYDTFLHTMFAQLGRDSAQTVAMHAQASLVPQATVKVYLRERLNSDPSQAAKGLTVPVLYLGSEKRWTADKDWATYSKEIGLDVVKKLTAQRVMDTGYFMMADHPDSVAARVAAFAAEAITAN